MEKIEKIIKFILGVVFIAVLHIALTSILPHPFSAFNTLFSVLAILLISNGRGYVVWIAFFTHFMIELYAITPFGITLTSATLAILATLWIYRYLFTNRSWYSVGALTFVSLVLYRAMFSIMIIAYHLVSGEDLFIFTRAIKSFTLEIVITSIGTMLVYILASKFVPKFSKQKVERSWFKTLSS